ncbi:CD276 antigen isoform X2 [Sardina pilchardus]|uniref:CD276 antigen isoform X2 n=1 Tax=Sardina pilchardus TaxID=27697 RepID=UPI002E0DED2F
MASVICILLVSVITATVPSAADFVTMKCQSSTGHSGQSSTLGCVVKALQEGLDIKIMKVFWKKDGNILLKLDGDNRTGDERFQLADINWRNSYDVSLLVKDTKISDAGDYSCTVVTNRGILKGTAGFDVKAKYSEPDLTFKPDKDIKDDDSVEITCVASGGYPRGAVHWFDNLNSNWTRSARTTVTQMEDKSFRLQSTFITKNPSHGPYTCVVYNSEWKKEGNNTFSFDNHNTSRSTDGGQTKNIAAGVVVIGSLIVGLLVTLLLCRRRSRRPEQHEDYDVEAEAEAEELHPCSPPSHSSPPTYEEALKEDSRSH